MKIKDSFFSITFLLVIGKIIGFLREMLLASYYGTSNIYDAYLMSISILTLFTSWLSSIVETSTPIYIEKKQLKSMDEANSYYNILILCISCLGITFSLLVLFFSNIFVNVVALGFSATQKTLTAKYLQIISPVIFFESSRLFLVNYNVMNQKVLKNNLFDIVVNFIFVLSIIICGNIDKNLLIFSYFIIKFIEFLLYSLNFKFHRFFKQNINDVKKTILFALPLFFSSAFSDINIFFDKIISSTLPNGSLSSLNYASSLRVFVDTLISFAIITTIYPKLSENVLHTDKSLFKNTVSKGIIQILLLSLPVSLGGFLLSNEIVSIVFKRGAFDLESVRMTSIAFQMYMIGLFAFSTRTILFKACYALREMKKVMIISISTIILNILLNLILSKYLLHAGLALATSIIALITLIPLILVITKDVGKTFTKAFCIIVIKVCITTLIMGLFIGYAKILLSELSLFLSFSIIVLMSIIIYVIILRLLKVNFFKILLKNDWS